MTTESIYIQNKYLQHETISTHLHKETLVLVKEERKLTGQVIEKLKEIAESNLHLKWGYSSLFDYCTKGLGYCESSAYRRIQAVKLVKVLPEIKDKLNSGSLNLTNLSMAQCLFSKIERTKTAKIENKTTGVFGVSNKQQSAKGFTPAVKKQILEKIENCSKKEAEIVLSELSLAHGVTMDTKPKEKVLHFGGEAALHIRVTKTTLEKLDRLKNLRAHKNPRMNYADIIADMAEFMLKKVDPLYIRPRAN